MSTGAPAVFYAVRMPDSLRVLLVDDDPLVRQLLRSLLEDDAGQPPITVVGEAGDGGEVGPLVAGLGPEVVLMDLGMPRVDGIEATRRLRSLPGAPHVIAMTTWDLDDAVARMVDAGAEGYILKAEAPQDAARAVRAVAAGEIAMSPQALRSLVRRMRGDRGEGDRRRAAIEAVGRLTQAEREAVVQAALGLSNAEIGELLFRSASTVKAQLASAQQRLGLKNRTQLAVLAERAGLLP